MADEIRSMRMATAVNALVLPAVAIPVGIEDGLPQAVQGRVLDARQRPAGRKTEAQHVM